MNCQNCVICLTSLEPPIEEEEGKEKLTVTGCVDGGANGGNRNCSEEPLADNLKVVFLLKNLFEVPNEKLEYYLENFGNPSTWAKLCAKCQKLVEEARAIWVNLLRAVKQFAEIRCKVVGEVGRSPLSTLTNDNCSESERSVSYTIIDDLRSLVNSGKSIYFWTMRALLKL